RLASACGRHLIDSRVITRGGALAWPGADRRALAGFAHGAAGIALALARLARVTGDRGLDEAVSAAYRYEKLLFSSSSVNWPVPGQTSREGEAVITAWCHGAAGIGLSRALVLDESADEDRREEMKTALLVTAKHAVGKSDHLCCGNLGRADVLLTAGLRLESLELVQCARGLVESVVARARERGRFALPSSPFRLVLSDPGFFKGLSGIGYQCLRMTSPQDFPSVLGFEIPPRARFRADETRKELQ
ncbi:MAG TPA: lanthionine synthetase LanC family protein, partial [Candidatus Polarisedimenticolaceae bacterium]|nr:lanthionine synthetase LanC family protein [Candidatus Polarisedimenticolaceae bacterium]